MHQHDAPDASRGHKRDVHALVVKGLNGLLQGRTGALINPGVLFFKNKHPSLLPDRKDSPQEGHISFTHGDTTPQGLEVAASGKIFQVITKKEKVGDLAGKRRPQKPGVVEAGHAQGRQTVQVGGAGHLQRGLAAESGVSMVPQAV